MENIDNQRFDRNKNPRLDHALIYITLRSLELDLGLEKFTLIVNHFEEKHAFGCGENKTLGGGA